MASTRQVILTPAQFAFAVSIATQRVANKGIWQRFVSETHTPFANHLIGAVGEFAASKVLKCKINQDILKNGDKGQPDLHCHLGGVEVKTSTWQREDVMLKLLPSELVDGVLFVLVVVNLPDTCRVYPPLYKSTITQIAKRQDFGYGQRLVVTGKQIEQYAMDF